MENSQYFNKVDLLIERTSNGLGYDYISPGLKKEDLGRLNISFDETNQVGQFNSGYCYSIQRTERHLIYSVINTDEKDSANRKGFFAVRLIVGANDLIENVHVNLGKVTQVYLGYLRDKSINHQNYDHILSQVATNVKRKSWLTPKINLDSGVYYQYVNIQDIKSELFNDPRLCFTNKVYFLNDKSGVADDVPRQFGFEPLANYWNKVREIQFLNPDRLNILLSIDNNSYSAGAEKFQVVCKATDVVRYALPNRPSTTVDSSEKTVAIKRPEVTIPLIVHNSRDGSVQKQKSLSTVLLCIGSIALGMIGGYFAHPYVEELLVKTPYSSEFTAAVVSNEINIEIDTAANNVIHFVNRGGQLDYVLKYEGKSKKWSYSNTKDNFKPKKSSFKPLTSASLDTLLKMDIAMINEVKNELQNFTSTQIPKGTEDTQPSRTGKEASSVVGEDKNKKDLNEDRKSQMKSAKSVKGVASSNRPSTAEKSSADAKTNNKPDTSNKAKKS